MQKQATDFENYLLEKGYKQHVFDIKKQKLVEKKVVNYSTMYDINSIYIKDEIKITVGISLAGFPPMLQTPVPIIVKSKHGMLTTRSILHQTQRLFELYDNEQILTAIETQKPLLFSVN